MRPLMWQCLTDWGDSNIRSRESEYICRDRRWYLSYSGRSQHIPKLLHQRRIFWLLIICSALYKVLVSPRSRVPFPHQSQLQADQDGYQQQKDVQVVIGLPDTGYWLWNICRIPIRPKPPLFTLLTTQSSQLYPTLRIQPRWRMRWRLQFGSAIAILIALQFMRTRLLLDERSKHLAFREMSSS
jgi:hypothetical protein